MNIFITGDRSLDPFTAAYAVGATIVELMDKHSGQNLEFYTGALETGVERAARYLIGDINVINHSLTDDGHPDLDGRHEAIAGTIDLAIMIHGDPLGSRIGASLVKYFTGDKLELIS